MNTYNPYQPPTAKLEKEGGEVWSLTNPRSLSAGRGWFWITEGFRLFKQSPGVWIVDMILFFIITIFIALIPIVSLLNNILQPILLGGLMQGVRVLDTEGAWDVNYLFAGFKDKFSKLAILGLLELLFIMAVGAVIGVIILLALFMIGMSAPGEGGFSGPQEFFTSVWFLLLIPVLFAMFFIMGMAIWLAPQLVVLHDLEPFEALKSSFRGSARNIIPMIVFGFLAILLVIPAVIPLGLGVLVLWPTLMAATYVAWKDIFTDVYSVT